MGSEPAAVARTTSLSLILVVLVACLAVSMVVCVGVGPARIAPGLVTRIIADAVRPRGTLASWTIGQQHIVLDLRMPRVLLGALVGAGLAVVGSVLQVITRNPLADPYLFGVSSGAAVGAVLVMLYTGNVIGSATLPIAAFVGALGSMCLVFFLAREPGGFGVARLVLTGVAVHFVLMAVTNGLVLNRPDRGADSALFWMLGGFSSARWDLVPFAAAAVLPGTAWIVYRARTLDALSLGDESAHTMGIAVGRLRLEMFVVTALMTGVLVSASGAVGFVGLVVPHCARWAAGAPMWRSVPVSALAGAIFTVWVDAAARTVLAPRELPLGVMTAAIGGLFFIVILARQRRSIGWGTSG